MVWASTVKRNSHVALVYSVYLTNSFIGFSLISRRIPRDIVVETVEAFQIQNKACTEKMKLDYILLFTFTAAL